MIFRTHTTGIHYTDKVVEWTVLRKDRSGTEKLDEGTTPISKSFFEQENKPLFPAGVLSEIRKRFKGTVTISLPSSHLLLRVLELPSVDPDELAGMVELQADQFSPFPLDQLTLSYELLQQKNGQSRVLALAAQRTTVDQLGELFKTQNVSIRSLDAEILAWWHLLKTRSKTVSSKGRVILMIEGHTEFSMIVIDDGSPVCFRSLELFRDFHDEEIMREIIEEVRYTILSLEAEYGVRKNTIIEFWSESELSDEMMKGLSIFAPRGIHLYDLKTIPPVSEGLAQRAAERGAHQAELIPREWVDLLIRKQIIRITSFVSLAVLALWLIVIAISGVVFGFKEAAYKRLQKEDQRYAEPARVAQAARSEMLSLEKYADRSHSSLESLREITELLPRGVEINSFTYTKGNAIQLRGSCQSSEPVYEFFQKLGQSHLFEGLKNEKVGLQVRQGNRIQGFSLMLKLPRTQQEQQP